MKNTSIYLGIFALGLALMAPGCLGWPSWIPFGNDPFSPGTDFVLDNDTVFDLFEDNVSVSPQQVKKKHKPGTTECPQKLDPVKVSAPEGSTYKVDDASVPAWLDMKNKSGSTPGEIGLNFNCNVPNFKNQEAKVKVSVTSPDGDQADSFFDVFMELE